MSTMDKYSGIPLYYQLMDIIINMIEEGNLKEDDQLPSERELCDSYEISRSTVRQAIQELEKEGYIYRLHGKGTFVSPKVFNQDLLKFYSFTDEMKKIGKVPCSKVLEFSVIDCSEKLSKKMKLSKSDKLYFITRLRLADNEPMMLETSYIPYNKFPGLNKELLEENPMYDIFKFHYGILITSAEEVFQSVLTKEEEAKFLGYTSALPSMMIERITYEKEEIVEYTKSIARGDRFRYSTVLKK